MRYRRITIANSEGFPPPPASVESSAQPSPAGNYNRDATQEIHSQLGRGARRRPLCAFPDLLLLLALLLASVVGALPHGQPPLLVRGRLGVAVFGELS